MAKKIYESYIPQHEEVAMDFVKYIKLNRNKDGLLKDILYHLTKFSIEGKIANMVILSLIHYLLLSNFHSLTWL